MQQPKDNASGLKALLQHLEARMGEAEKRRTGGLRDHLKPKNPRKRARK